MDTTNILNKIRVLRDKKGFSQEYMAQQFGIGRTSYTDIENENTQLTWKTIDDIAKILKVDPLSLVSEKDIVIINSQNQNNQVAQTLHNYLPEKLLQSYESQIELLEEQNANLKVEIQRLKNG